MTDNERLNYGEHLRMEYFKNKNTIDKHRQEIGFTYELTLEDKLIEGYKAYKEFCYATNIKPRMMLDFLKTKII